VAAEADSYGGPMVGTDVTTTRRRGRLRAVRVRVRSWPGGRLLWRVGVTLVGAAVIAVGIVLLPLPGPGWVIIFGGLGILGSEYAWARRLLARMRHAVADAARRLASKPLWVRLLAGLLTLLFLAAVVLGGWLLLP
jgi:uncharacterized protein (TIGR02611 family)